MKFILIFIISLSGLCLKAQSPFHAVRTHLHLENFDQVKTILDSCSFVNHSQDSVLFYRGLLLLKKGNIRAAWSLGISLQKSYPAFKEVHYLRALAYFMEEDYGKSIEEFSAVIKNYPGHIKAYYNRSLAFGLLEDYPSAIKDLETCISIDSGYAMAYYSRAYWYEFLNHYEKAKADYEHCLSLDPKNYDAYFGIAYIYKNQKEYQKACETINQAIQAGSQIAVDLKENFCR